MTDHPTTDLVPPPPEIQGDAARAVPVTVAQMAAARAFLLDSSDSAEVTDAAVWRHAANAVLARQAVEQGLDLPEGTLAVPTTGPTLDDVQASAAAHIRAHLDDTGVAHLDTTREVLEQAERALTVGHPPAGHPLDEVLTPAEVAAAVERIGPAYARRERVDGTHAPEDGLALNGDEGINARLCRALGVDPETNVGYRLTVLGGEFPALEVFQLPPQTGDGMFSASGPLALEDLVADGATVVPPHLALTEFGLAKLLDAHATLQNLCASPVSTDGEEIAELRRQQFQAFSALEAVLSRWAEAGAPDPKVVAVVTAVVDEHGVSFTAETPDDIGIEEGTEVECYLVPVVEPADVEPGDQPVPPADPS